MERHPRAQPAGNLNTSASIRALQGVGILALLAGLSWLTIAADVPRLYAPFNLVVWVPYVLAEAVFGNANLGYGFVPTWFALWCWPILRGSPFLPMRSIILLLVALYLSFLAQLAGFGLGGQYRNLNLALLTTFVNGIWWVVLGIMAWLASHRPNEASNLTFHTALFVWLAWYAVPYLGELP